MEEAFELSFDRLLLMMMISHFYFAQEIQFMARGVKFTLQPTEAVQIQLCSLTSAWASWRSRYRDWLWTGRSGDRIPVRGEIFRTCPDRPWSPPSLLYNGYRVFPGCKERLGLTLIPHPLLVSWSRKSTAIPLFLLRAVRPVQGLSACTRVRFSFTFSAFRFSRNFFLVTGLLSSLTLLRSLLLLLLYNCVIMFLIYY